MKNTQELNDNFNTEPERTIPSNLFREFSIFKIHRKLSFITDTLYSIANQ